MKYFTIAGEDRRLDDATRRQLRGDYITLSDGVTHYELRGPADGPVVVVVPGMTIPLFYWDAFAIELHARGLRTLAYSAYGRGYSDRLHFSYTESLFCRQLRELIAALKVSNRLHIVGTSMGAIIALGCVARDPQLVARLTLVGPAGLSDSTARQQRMLRSDLVATLVAKRFGRKILLGHLGHNVSDPELAKELTAMISDCYRFEGSMYGFFSTLQNVDLYGREALFRAVGTGPVPTQLIWGRRDRVTPTDAMDTARGLLNSADTYVMDCGHMAAYERPADVAERVAAFTSASTDRI